MQPEWLPLSCGPGLEVVHRLPSLHSPLCAVPPFSPPHLPSQAPGGPTVSFDLTVGDHVQANAGQQPNKPRGLT